MPTTPSILLAKEEATTAMDMSVANGSPSLANRAPTDFPQFSRLPPEMRCPIWREAALEAYKDRLLVLGCPLKRIQDYWGGAEYLFKPAIHPNCQMRPSAIFLTNRESRRVARSIYNVSLHVYDTNCDDGTTNGCGGPLGRDGPFDVAYRGEVYISLVHDFFLAFDDSSSLPGGYEIEMFLYQLWSSDQTTGRLSVEQTTSIERIIIIRWASLDRPDLGSLIDAYAAKIKKKGTDMDKAFKEALLHYDLYLDINALDEGALTNAIDSSAGNLLKLYPGQYRRRNFSL